MAALPAWWAEACVSSLSRRPPADDACATIAEAANKFDAAAASSALCERGYIVLDNFVDDATAAKAVRDGILRLDRGGSLALGRIQHATSQTTNTASRTDRIAFLPSPNPNSKAKQPPAPAAGVAPALHAFTLVADALRVALTRQTRLVERVGGALDDCNYMCAVYPGGGARYVKHRDALPFKAGRKLTVIYYLNGEWQPGDGGELRIWPLPEGLAEPVVVPPLADRLLVFISSLEHEVLPAWRPRYALTTWMFNQRDTALEALAGEMRQRKAAGKMDTKALLAALDADSSSDDDAGGGGGGDGDSDSEEEEGGGVDRKAAMAVMMQLLRRKQAQTAKLAETRARRPHALAPLPGAGRQPQLADDGSSEDD